MTTTTAAPVLSGIGGDGPAVVRPEGCLYYSPRGLFEFQAEGVARSYWQFVESDEPVTDVLWDTGIGKTHLAMATAAMLFEDGLLDHVVVVAEANKVKDWAEDDFPGFTSLSVAAYAGDKARRKRILDNPPQVLVTTYETGRNDICVFAPGKSKAVKGPGPLADFLRGKRVLVVFDEVTKLRSRGTALYVAWDYLLNRVLRKDKTGKVMVAGMTATKIEKSPEDHFNANRVLVPWRSPSVEAFNSTYIAAYDNFGNPSEFKNLTPDACAPGVIPFNRLYAPVTLRKRKTDQDVIDHFPRKVENPPRIVGLDTRHRQFYEAVEDVFADADEAEQRQAFTLLRQIAGDPMSLLRSNGAMAKAIVGQVGAEGLAALGNAKIEEMLDWARTKGDEQMVLFTFFGQSVLPNLATALHSKGYMLSLNHGQMSADERKRSQDAFKAGDTQIFLSSDAGARGLNLGCGSALLHYELPVLYSVFVQRSDRIHRIDSVHPSVTIDALVAKGTIEEAIAKLLIKRNGWSDKVINDEAYTEDYDPGEQFVTAADRRALLDRALRMAS